MNDDLVAAFDELAHRFGYVDALQLRAKEKRTIITRLRRQQITPARFRGCVLHALQIAQQRAERAAAGQRRHERKMLAKKLAKRIEREVLASLVKPVSRAAGRAEHLAVLANLPADRFYRTAEWRKVRWDALHAYGRRCCSCGATPEDEARLTATHVVSRLVAPERAFDLSNLRILCADCHIGRRALTGPQDA